MCLLQLLAIGVEKLIPSVDVSAHVLQGLAPTVLTQALSTCVVDDLPLALEVLMEAAPNGEAVALLRLPAGQLSTPKIKSFR
jgi:hypothetical protein